MVGGAALAGREEDEPAVAVFGLADDGLLVVVVGKVVLVVGPATQRQSLLSLRRDRIVLLLSA